MQYWYVLQTKVNSEERVEGRLRHKYEVYCPKTPADKRTNPKKPVVPLFEGYLFIRMTEKSDWHAVVKTPGVINFVQFGESPAILSDVVVDELWLREFKEHYGREVRDYQPGDTVRVISGAFEHKIATIHEKPSKDRINILLEIFGRQNLVSVTYSDLEPVEKNEL